jgi:hypothetical protein
MVARRTRVVRARTVQHALAVAETVRAQDEANSIENNAIRLRRVREDLFDGAGVSTGASFGAYRELAGRLEAAGRQLDGALYDARRKVDEKQGRSIEANREKEIAERLKDQARAALEEKIEQRLAALPRFRGPRTRQEG